MRALVCVLSVRMPICAAGEAHRLVPERMDRHRHQRDAHLLAGREQHVHLAGRRVVGDLLGEVDQVVGLVAHRADDHHDLVAVLLGANRPPGGRLNLFRIGDARAAEFLNDDSHRFLVILDCSVSHGGHRGHGEQIEGNRYLAPCPL